MSIVSRLTNRFWQSEGGNTGVIFALAFIPTVVLTGGAVDVGNVYNQRMRLQGAVDAATLAANSLSEATASQRSAMALKVFQANVSQNSGLANITPTITAGDTTVTVTASTLVPTPFLSVMQMSSMTITAASTAGARVIQTTTTPGKVCMLALDPTSADGIHIQGDNDIKYIDCWAHTNSAMGTAINADGSQASAVGLGHCAVGGSSVPHNNFSPAVLTNCKTVADPFAEVGAYDTLRTYKANFTLPSVSDSCTATNLNLKKGTFTLNPGRYCGGISIQAQATVTFNPGIYIIENGEFLVQSGSNVTANNVLFYLPPGTAKFTVIGGGTVNMTGRTTGSSYAGFLIIAHPNANRDGESNIQGGGTMKLQGVIYAPRQTIEVSGNGHVNGTSNYFAMVAKNFYFRGNGEFHFKKHNGSTTVPDIMPMMPFETRRESYVSN